MLQRKLEQCAHAAESAATTALSTKELGERLVHEKSPLRAFEQLVAVDLIDELDRDGRDVVPVARGRGETDDVERGGLGSRDRDRPSRSRVLAVLTTWVGMHYRHTNADPLVRCVSEHGSNRVHVYWAAVAHWLSKDRGFARLATLHDGPPVDLLSVGTDFQIARRGEDERFAGSPRRVPAGTLRDRDADVLSPEALVRRHTGYRNRVLMGPIWRADVWTALEADPDVSVAEAARRAGCSFATAWQVVQDFRLLRAAPQYEDRAAGQI